ncbi:alanine or glycine:cation symporter, AGCS family [Lentzea xinjiangensis]|uniref:Alanine or glycine:cation symporter, AGCS family n=1 Tax=Lentzea xinjiangensis TaxID=402600 RepID=A0A1H9RUD2_9PSEU|nr:sodium:alanine symporter family protein [Lentzea xinjiangensis]SER76158.1 alanine or glycine:cation symporter, AGCS family [Lentzea xinjiangensis]
MFGLEFPWIVAWLVTAATIFSVYFEFIQFGGFGMALGLVRGKYSKKDDPGEIKHFEALTCSPSRSLCSPCPR